MKYYLNSTEEARTYIKTVFEDVPYNKFIGNYIIVNMKLKYFKNVVDYYETCGSLITLDDFKSLLREESINNLLK